MLPNPWKFHGLVLWLLAIGCAIEGVGLTLGYIGWMFK